MYKVQEKPDGIVELSNGSKVTPIVTLKSKEGGVCHIIVDDRCYVLINKCNDTQFCMTKHWFKEAAEALSKCNPTFHLGKRAVDLPQKLKDEMEKLIEDFETKNATRVTQVKMYVRDAVEDLTRMSAPKLEITLQDYKKKE